MSTVDAAIINYITNGGGSSGGGGGSGVSYTAGDGISLTNNQIAVKYNTSTMEIVNGALSAKVSSSGGGSSGGSEEIMTHLTDVHGRYSTGNYLEFTGLRKDQIYTGLRLRLKRGETDFNFVLVVRNYDFPSISSATTNATFIGLDTNGFSFDATIYNDAADSYNIQCPYEIASEYVYWSEDGMYGLFEAQQHSTRALTAMFTNDIMARLWPQLQLIKYLETTVEALKQKVGL